MKRGFLLVFALTLVLTPAALAEDRDDEQSDGAVHGVTTSIAPAVAGSRPWDRLAVRLGGFAASFKTTVQFDSDTLGVGTEFDLENDTSLDGNKTQGSLNGHIRFGARHRLDYGAVLFRRSAANTINRQIQFGDTVFDVNAFVETKFRNDVIKLAYRYDVVRRPGWDLGLSFGISAFAIDLSLSATGGGGGMTSTDKEDFVAPIPVIGLHADVRLAEKWYLRTGGEFFDVRVDNQKGGLSDVRAAVDWFPFEHFGFGAGFNRSRLSYEDLGIPGIDIAYAYSGTTLYISYVR